MKTSHFRISVVDVRTLSISLPRWGKAVNLRESPRNEYEHSFPRCPIITTWWEVRGNSEEVRSEVNFLALLGNFPIWLISECEQSFLGVPSSPAAAGASPRRSLGFTDSFVLYSLTFVLFILKFAWQISTFAFRFSGIFSSCEARI